MLTGTDTLPIALTVADKYPTAAVANSFRYCIAEQWENLLNADFEVRNTESVNLAQKSLSQAELPCTEIEAISPINVALPATPIPGHMQFFRSRNPPNYFQSLELEKHNKEVLFNQQVQLIIAAHNA